MPPSYAYDLPRLQTAWQKSRQSLQRARDERREAVRQAVGDHYADEGAKEKVYLPLLWMYTDIVVGNLVANDPRVMLSTKVGKKKPMVHALETWANEEIRRMELAEVLKRAVVDAAYCMGIVKVGLATPPDAARYTWGLEEGQPFAQVVDLDDYACDPHARVDTELQWEGHRYRVPLETVKDSKLYSKDRKQLSASPDAPYNREGDERIGMIGRGFKGTGGSDEEYRDMVDLWEFFIPSGGESGRGLILTLAEDQMAGGSQYAEPLRAQEWVGPYCGPFHRLGLSLPVPGNLIPSGPIQRLRNLDFLVNRLYRKLARQADRQKAVGLYAGTSAEDAERWRKAADGEMIRMENPDRVKWIDSGGPNAFNGQFTEQARTLFSWVAGNLDAAGGLSSQAGTLGQERLLDTNSSRSIAHMQDRAVKFTGSVLDAMLWFWYLHPTKVMHTTYPIAGLPKPLRRRVYPHGADKAVLPAGTHVRDLPYEQLDVRVDPYSQRHRTPQERLADLERIVTQVVMPMLPLLQQQGHYFDIGKFLEKESEYGDMPDLPDIITLGPGVQERGGDQGGGATEMPHTQTKPANTSRTVTRVNRSEATGPGDSKVLQQNLLAAGGGQNGRAGVMGRQR